MSFILILYFRRRGYLYIISTELYDYFKLRILIIFMAYIFFLISFFGGGEAYVMVHVCRLENDLWELVPLSTMWAMGVELRSDMVE